MPLDYSQLPTSIDAVIHLAQSRFYKQFPERAEDIFDINVGSTFQLLDYARRAGAKRFLFTSTGGIYGSGLRAFVETDAARPTNFYLSSKHIAEQMVDSYSQFFHTTLFRLFFVYGAGQAEAMLMPSLVRSVLVGKPLILQGGDGILINPVHVSDVVRALELALELDGHQLFNLAGAEVLSLREIGNIIGAELGREPVFEVREEEPPSHLIADITRMHELLVEPRVSFREGVKEVCRMAEAVG